MSDISLSFGLVRKGKKFNLIDQKAMVRVSILKDCLILEMRIQIFKIQLLILQITDLI